MFLIFVGIHVASVECQISVITDIPIVPQSYFRLRRVRKLNNPSIAQRETRLGTYLKETARIITAWKSSANFLVPERSTFALIAHMPDFFYMIIRLMHAFAPLNVNT